MKHILLLLLTAAQCFSAAYTSTQSGLFSSDATWGGGGHPNAAADTFTISTGHTVIYDMDNKDNNGWGASTVTGTLLMSNTVPCWFKMQGNLSGAGKWYIGSAAEPVDFVATNLPAVVVEFTGSAVCSMNATSALLWYGKGDRMWYGTLHSAANIGATNLVVSSPIPSSLGPNCLIALGENGGNGGSVYVSYFVVGNIENGTNLYFNTGPFTSTLTNTLYDATLSTSVPTYNRTAGSYLALFASPIVVLEKTERSVSLVSVGQVTNIYSGVRWQNCGRNHGATVYSGCQGSRAENCIVFGCPNGGIFAYGQYQVASNCYIFKGGMGGVFRYSEFSTAQDCLTAGSQYGIGLGTIGCLITNCVAFNNGSGGILGAAYYGTKVAGCRAYAVDQGGLCLAASGVVFDNNEVYYGRQGALAGSVVGCQINGMLCSSVGTCALIYGYSSLNQPGGYNLALNVTNSANVPLTTYNGSLHMLNASGYTNVSPMQNWNDEGVVQFDYTRWANYGGEIEWRTDFQGGEYRHSITNPAGTTLNLQFSVRPQATRSITVSCYQTNNVAYYAAIGMGKWRPLGLTLICPSAESGGWTNVVLSYLNTNRCPEDRTVWVKGAATSVPATGYSRVELGADVRVVVQ